MNGSMLRPYFNAGKRLSVVLLSVLAGIAQSVHSAEVAQEEFDCLIEPKMRVMVGAPTQGIISSIDVERSQLVEPGQVLASLESSVEKAALEQARVRAHMSSEVEARKADLQLARINMRRAQELWDKGMIPKQQFDEAKAQLEVASSSLKQARDNRTMYEHEFTRANRVLQEHTIRSPIAGVVVEQTAFPGEFVYENPIMTLAQIHPLKVEAILPARFFGKVQVGMTAHVLPEIEQADPLRVQVAGVDRLIDAASGTFSVLFELPNETYEIPGGQRCTLSFLPSTNKDKDLEQYASVE